MPKGKFEESEGSSGLQEPPAKKQRRALNFSIESIMQQSPKSVESTSISPPSANLVVSHSVHEFISERSPSSFVSSASSSLSSPTPSVSPLAGDEIDLGHTQQQHHHHHHHHHNHNHHNHHHHQQHQHEHQHQHNSMRRHMKESPSSVSMVSTIPAGSTAASCGTGSGSGDSRLSQVECQLDNKDMWDKFHSLNTEMIITKTGRRMFPVMKVQFHNLNPNARYAVSMDIVPVDNKRYRYAYHKSCWQVAGKADPSAEPRLYPHPDSPFNGDLLSRQVISFEKVKLTNNEMDKSGHIILNSMHKYQPRVHLIELKAPPTNNQQTTSSSKSSENQFHRHQNNYHHHQQQQQSQHQSQNNHQNHHHHNHHHQQQQQQQQQPPQLDIEGYRTFVFPETVFTAVTAYQNQLITKMKIDKNPFAKGFRDSSRLSDMDRNDPFDYMGSLGPSGRFVGHSGPPSSMEAAAAAGAHMDAYQLLASAANNPWYSAAAVAAAAGGGNPFNPMGACSTAQAAQMQATQMWLAAFSACLNGGTTPGATPIPPLGPLSSASMLPTSNSSPLITSDQTLGGDPNGPDSSGGSSSSSANSSGTGT